MHAGPDEHAAARPVKGQDARLGDDAPVGVGGARGRGLLELVRVLLEDAAHEGHAALILAAQAGQPAHPAVEAPAGKGGFVVQREGVEGAQGGGGLRAADELGDEGLHEARRLLSGGLSDAVVVLVHQVRALWFVG